LNIDHDERSVFAAESWDFDAHEYVLGAILSCRQGRSSRRKEALMKCGMQIAQF
jgi:hypothetical protein